MLANRLVVVTGANKGIGYAIVEKLLQHKDKPNVILTYRNPALGKEAFDSLVKKYPSEKDRLSARELDLGSDSSISNFSSWLSNTHDSFDVLVNNAALGNVKDIMNVKGFALSPEEVKQYVQTNYYATVNLTETLLPFLSGHGKIVNVSSTVARLGFQGKAVKDFLNNPSITMEALDQKLREFEEKAIKGEHEAAGFSKSTYSTTKAFLNAYTRFILLPKLQGNQTCFSVHPGWCKTNMGTDKAPLTAEQGATSTLTVLDFDEETSKKNSGKFFDEKGKETSY